MARTKTNSSGYPLYPPKPEGWRSQQRVISTTVGFAFLAALPWLPILGWFTIFDSSTNYGLGNLAYVFAYAAAGVGFNYGSVGLDMTLSDGTLSNMMSNPLEYINGRNDDALAASWTLSYTW